MGIMGKKETCLNPWYGFGIILTVCLIIGTGVFFEFNGKGAKITKSHAKAARQKAAAKQVAFKMPDADAPGDKLTI
jgi:hypothetical protein